MLAWESDLVAKQSRGDNNEETRQDSKEMSYLHTILADFVVCDGLVLVRRDSRCAVRRELLRLSWRVDRMGSWLLAMDSVMNDNKVAGQSARARNPKMLGEKSNNGASSVVK